MRATALLTVVLGALSLGCESLADPFCDRSVEANPFVRYTEGTTEDGVYMSSAWDGELLYFPGGMHYELEHALGAAPRWVDSYLSFSRSGTEDEHGVAEATGNQAVVIGVDDRVIQIKNDSCVEYWLLVVAGSGDVPPAPP